MNKKQIIFAISVMLSLYLGFSFWLATTPVWVNDFWATYLQCLWAVGLGVPAVLGIIGGVVGLSILLYDELGDD